MSVDATAEGRTYIAGLFSSAALRQKRLLVALSALAALLALAGLLIGPARVSLGDVWAGLLSLLGLSDEPLTQGSAIASAVRAPRIVLGMMVGGALGIAGAAMQGLFRNPLVDPGLIGVSSGGALGAATMIVLGGGAIAALPLVGPIAIPVAAFLGSLAAMGIVYLFGQRDGALSVATMLLAGIAINALAGAGLGYLTFLSSDQQLRTLTFWLLGSLGGATWLSILPAVIFMGAAAALILRQRAALDLYVLGEREAKHLGCDTDRLKRHLVLGSTLAAGAAVALCGTVGFIGLAAPHLVRFIAGPDHRIVLPGSALLGASLVLGADIIARMAVTPAELPIGVVTGALGAPFFLWLLRRMQREALL